MIFAKNWGEGEERNATPVIGILKAGAMYVFQEPSSGIEYVGIP
jgi:hypothetical protein